jgi:hypothetical protein
MDRSIVVWIGTIVVVLVFLDLLFVELRRIFREGKRLAKRLAAYRELPIISRLATGERDVERILAAIDALGMLMERAQRAIAVLRRYIPKGSSPG